MIMLNNRPLYVGTFKPLIISGIEPDPGTILQTTIEPNYGQYCWIIPIDILLNCKTNNLVLDITAYTTQTGTGSWDSDHRFFALRTNYSGEYTILNGVTSFAPIDSNGYRGMTISNWSDALLNNILNWKYNGDTNVLLHSPSSQTSKFISPPTCIMTHS